MTSLHFFSVRPPFQAPGLWTELSVDLGPGWTSVSGPNGAGKTTLLALACGALSPSQGQITGPEPRLLVPQVPLVPPGGPAGPWEFPSGARWASRLGVQDDWWNTDRWTTLSSGERQRGLLAWCLAQEPAVLALDEPTNHLDEGGQRILLDALAHYEGLGLVATHDEAALEALSQRTLWLEPGGPWLEQGPWAVVREEALRRRHEGEAERLIRQKLIARVEKEEARRRHEAHQADVQKTSKRRLDPRDHDGKARINMARVSGKDGVTAHQAALWTKHLEGCREEQRPQGPVKRGMRIEATDQPLRSWSEWRLAPGERVVITGANGSGKSTWLRQQVGGHRLVAYLSQDPSPEAGLALVREFSDDGPRRDQWLSKAARWGLDPVRILQTPAPSPGEVQKLRLAALGLDRWSVLALDEPTNHLDLEAKALLADALREFAGTIVLISHDRPWWQPLGFREVAFG